LIGVNNGTVSRTWSLPSVLTVFWCVGLVISGCKKEGWVTKHPTILVMCFVWYLLSGGVMCGVQVLKQNWGPHVGIQTRWLTACYWVTKHPTIVLVCFVWYSLSGVDVWRAGHDHADYDRLW
jgi:hypothetical protein